MTARQARAALGAFLVLSAGIIINAFFMQNSPEVIASAKAKAAREAARAELQRARVLSIDGVDQKRARRRLEWRSSKSAQKTAPPKTAWIIAGQTNSRVARLRQDAARLPDEARTKLQHQDLRLNNVRAIQRELSARNYEPGLVDGVPGLVTRAAIMAYEFDQKLPLTGEPSASLLRRIILGASNEVPGGSGLAEPNSQARRVTRTVQQSLRAMGYQPGAADGVAGDDTSRAIREFEMDHGMVPTGRISGKLVGQLARLVGRGRLASKQN